MVECEENEYKPYILEFDIPKKYMEPHSSMAKVLNARCATSGLLICSLLPKKPNRKFDVKLGKRFKSSKMA